MVSAYFFSLSACSDTGHLHRAQAKQRCVVHSYCENTHHVHTLRGDSEPCSPALTAGDQVEHLIEQVTASE